MQSAKKSGTICSNCQNKPVIFKNGWEILCEDCQRERDRSEREKRIKDKISRTMPCKYWDIETDRKDVLGMEGQSLFINGTPGTGKTVLACSLAKKYIREGNFVKFINFPAYIMELQCAYRKDTENPFMNAESTAKFHGVLVIDDLGAEKLTDFVKQVIYFIINEREQRCLTTIITSNFSLGDLDSHIDSRISSRIVGMCRVVKLNGVDRRMKK